MNVRAGCPNLIERVEGGLLSYGSDMTLENNPFECGLGRFCTLSDDVNGIGTDALKSIREQGPHRKLRAISVDGPAIAGLREPWPLFSGGTRVGQITSAAWSPDFGTNVSIGMVETKHCGAGTVLNVETPHGARRAIVQDAFWI